MNLAISNLAWNPEENENVFLHLNELGIKYIEGVLTKISNWDNLNIERIKNFKNSLDNNGLKIESLQSIFFGISCEGLHETKTILPHFEKLIEYSEILGVRTLVLGSPNLRKKVDNIEKRLSEVFFKLDGILNGTKIKVCLEPNAKVYGGEYFYNVEEIVNFIKINNFSNIKTMVDTHNSYLENLDPSSELEKYYQFIEHIHVSEPKLSPIHNHELHEKFSETLKRLKYDNTVTYELNINDNFRDNLKKFITIYN